MLYLSSSPGPDVAATGSASSWNRLNLCDGRGQRRATTAQMFRKWLGLALTWPMPQKRAVGTCSDLLIPY